MKKVIYLILILVISVSVVGCGSNNQPSNTTNTTKAAKIKNTTNNQKSKINIEKLDAAMKKNPPKIAGPYLQRGRYRMQNNDFNGAIEDFNTALQYEPNNKVAQSLLKEAKVKSNIMKDAGVNQ